MKSSVFLGFTLSCVAMFAFDPGASYAQADLQSTLESTAECLKDCESRLDFCNSLVAGALPACERGCESECDTFLNSLNPFTYSACINNCKAACLNDHASGVGQCSMEYGACSAGCRSKK